MLCCCFSGMAQDKTTNNEFVKCYYNLSSHEPIQIYDAIDGKIVKSFYNQNSTNSWYKLAFSESDYGWFKIKRIESFPDNFLNSDYQNYWVKSKDFFITIRNHSGNTQVYIYDLPTTSSNRIHKLDPAQEVEIIEISELWTKIKLTVGKKDIEGWLPFKNQCANPLNSCSKVK